MGSSHPIKTIFQSSNLVTIEVRSGLTLVGLGKLNAFCPAFATWLTDADVEIVTTALKLARSPDRFDSDD